MGKLKSSLSCLKVLSLYNENLVGHQKQIVYFPIEHYNWRYHHLFYKKFGVNNAWYD